MVKIIIQGAGGRMGKALIELIAQREDCQVVAGIDTYAFEADFPIYESLALVQEKADVLIDFSHPKATLSALEICAEIKLPCVVCTTGLDDETKTKMKQVSQNIAVFYSANMSLGVNLLAELVRKAAKVLSGFDIEIIEKHHNNKLDAPSGTALMLAEEINDEKNNQHHYMYDRHSLRQKRDALEIGIHAVRGGSIVGEHDVIFAGPDEVITLSHAAYSRDVFANGAVSAALFLAGKQAGIYSMKDVLNAK